MRVSPDELERYPTGARWLDLLATVSGFHGPEPVERLTDPGVLARWLDRAGLTPEVPPGDDDVVRFRELREHLRALASAVVGGYAVPAGSVAALNAATARDEALVAVAVAGGLALAPPGTADVAAARLAREAASDLGGARAGQLRECDDDVCGAIYVDPTGRRRWCSAEVCGVRNRVREHRRRSRT